VRFFDRRLVLSMTVQNVVLRAKAHQETEWERGHNNKPEPKPLTRERKRRSMATQTGGGAEYTHTHSHTHTHTHTHTHMQTRSPLKPMTAPTKGRELAVSTGWRACFEYRSRSLGEHYSTRHLPNVRKSEHKILISVNSHNFVGPTDPPQGIEGRKDGRKSVQKASAQAAATKKEKYTVRLADLPQCHAPYCSCKSIALTTHSRICSDNYNHKQGRGTADMWDGVPDRCAPDDVPSSHD
jgi:hypothetical protein